MSIGRVPGATGIQPSIVTAKGDLIVATASGSVTNQAVGSNNQVLMADSAQADGVKWANEATSTLTTTGDMLYASAANTLARRAIGSTGDVLTVSGGLPTWAAPAAGGMTLISTTTLSGASITLSSIPSTYNHLQLVIRNFIPATDGRALFMRYNNDSNSRYISFSSSSTYNNEELVSFASNSIQISSGNDNAVSQSLIVLNIYDYKNTVTWKINDVRSIITAASPTTSFRYWNASGAYNQTSAITDITLFTDTGNLTSGTVLLYGVK